MTYRILKYRLPSHGTVEMPLGKYRPLAVGEQQGDPVIWLINDVDSEQLPHRFMVFWTGDTLPDDLPHHVGTVTLPNPMLPNGLVVHVFMEAVG